MRENSRTFPVSFTLSKYAANEPATIPLRKRPQNFSIDHPDLPGNEATTFAGIVTIGFALRSCQCQQLP
jgi:hypothetical protein